MSILHLAYFCQDVPVSRQALSSEIYLRRNLNDACNADFLEPQALIVHLSGMATQNLEFCIPDRELRDILVRVRVGDSATGLTHIRNSKEGMALREASKGVSKSTMFQELGNLES